MKKFKTHFLFFLSLTLLLSCFSFNDTYAEESQVINFGQVVKNHISTAGEPQTYLLAQTQPGKITISMDVPQDAGINYDLYLYRYKKDTGDLEFVDGSINAAGRYELVSVICEPGTYAIGIMLKDLTAAPKEYAFIAAHSSNYSANEPNDKLNQAKEYPLGTVLKDSMDNPFDEDYYWVKVEEEADYQVILKNIPENAQYHVSLFDTSYNLVAGNSLTSEKTNFNAAKLAAGIYIIHIAAEQGYSDTQEYEFQLYKKMTDSKFLLTKSGQMVELTNNALYIDGVKTDMHWTYRHSLTNYTREQNTTPNKKSSFASILKNGSYHGPQDVTSDDCIVVYMDNFLYTYFYKELISGGAYDFDHTRFNDTEYQAFFVDVKSNKVIDMDYNWYKRALNMKQIFTEF